MSNEEIITAISNGGDRKQLMLELWQQNKGIAYKVVKRLQGYADVDDLMQEAYIGLDEAVRHYEPAAGTAFSTVAVLWMRQVVQRYLDNTGGTVRIPANFKQKLLRYRKAKDAFYAETGRSPSDQELCERLSVSMQELEDMHRMITKLSCASIDKPIEASEGSDEVTLCDVLPDETDSYAAADERLFNTQLSVELWEAVDSLPEQQPTLLRARYQEGLTVKAAGEKAGLSPNEARKQERNALQALGRGKNRRRLSPYFYQIRSEALRGSSAARFRETFTSSTERVALRLYEAGITVSDLLKHPEKVHCFVDGTFEKETESD